MVMASSHAKEISEVIRRMRRKEALEKYWDKIAIKEDGYDNGQNYGNRVCSNWKNEGEYE